MANDDAIARAHPGRDCPACGKPNRAGQVRCVICGTALEGDESLPPPPPAPPPRAPVTPEVLPPDIAAPPALPTPAFDLPPDPGVRAAATPRRRVQREQPWLWPAAAGGLLLTIGVLYWISTILAPSTDEVLLAPPPEPPRYRVPAREPEPARPPAVAPVPVAPPPVAPPANAVAPPAQAYVPPVARVPENPPAAAPPPPAAEAPSRSVRIERPARAPAPSRRARTDEDTPAATVPVPDVPPVPAADTAVAVAPEPAVVATPAGEPPPEAAPPRATEGAYRAAVDVHNKRVDEYNAIVAEMHQKNAWDDPEQFAELHKRLDRSRASVESARTRAERIRAQLDARRARR